MIRADTERLDCSRNPKHKREYYVHTEYTTYARRSLTSQNETQTLDRQVADTYLAKGHEGTEAKLKRFKRLGMST